jgi:protease-4
MSKNHSSSGIVAWILVGILVVLLLLSVAINFGLLAGIASGVARKAKDKPEDECPRLTEKWSYGNGTIKAARIAVNGIIMRETDGGPFRLRTDKVEGILREIRAATADPEVKGIILEVNSPGGDLTSSDEIYAALQRFKNRDPERRIVSFAGGIAASGGYYVSLPGDHIIAEPTAVIGSIGVILQTLNWKVLAEKIGVTDTTIKSGENKDLLNPFRDVSPEQKALVQNLIDTFHQRFFDLVCASRQMNADQLRPLADGRIFSATAAQQNGLVDSIGYWEDAVKKMAELLSVPDVRVIRYEYHPSFSEILANLRSPWPDIRALASEPPRLLYLWRP